RTGSDGDTTKWNTLSRASASSGSLTLARMFRDATVNGANVTLPDPPGAALAGSDWMAWPSTSSVRLTFDAGVSPWFTRPAVTATRSWFSNRVRCSDTGVTDRLAVGPDATLTVVSVVRSGSLTSSLPGVCSQPRRWKSLMRMISRRGS